MTALSFRRVARLGVLPAMLSLVMAACGGGEGSSASGAVTTAGQTWTTAPTTTTAATTTTTTTTTAADTVTTSAVPPTTTVPMVAPLVVDGPGRYEAEVASGGLVRRFLLVVPENALDPAPLVLVFHGFTRSPEEIEATSGMTEVAEREGFVVAYPAGTGFPSRWLVNPRQGTQDVDLARGLVALIGTAVPIDARRVFAAGFSNGGGMAARLACDAADLVAAVGPVAATYPSGACRPSRPVPVAAIHGTADPIVPYAGRGEALPAVEAVTAAWVVRNGCKPEPSTQEIAADVTLVSWGGCAAGADVALYRVAEGRHGWPGSGDTSIWGATTGSIDAAALLWEFFAAHPMP